MKTYYIVFDERDLQVRPVLDSHYQSKPYLRKMNKLIQAPDLIAAQEEVLQFMTIISKIPSIK